MPLRSYKNYPYVNLNLGCHGDQVPDIPEYFWFNDHFGGYDENFVNPVLDSLNDQARSISVPYHFIHHQIVDRKIKQHYSNIEFHYSPQMMIDTLFHRFEDYHMHPENTFQNFVCSFNGSAHVSRKLLAAILHRLGWFDLDYCSKNFSHEVDVIDGHIQDHSPSDQNNFYRKFFIGDKSADFFGAINSFGHVRYNHARNIYNLEHRLTKSFLHIVSETMATSHYPHVTEKFLYSIVTRGLFLAYAQPGWHDHLERYYGFRRYTKLFDYRFDSNQNPVERLVELMTMIAKFSVLSSDDWRDLYDIESETVEYNYDHYFSKQYVEHLKKYE